MAVVSNDIVTRFSFAGSLAPLIGFNNEQGKANALLVKGAAAAIAAGAAIAAYTHKVAGAKQEIGFMADRTGLGVEAIQELGFAADVTGSSADAMSSTLEGLSTAIADAALQGNENFARLGLSIHDANGALKSADDLLLDFSDRIRGMGAQQAQSLAAMVGIDSTLVPLLMKGRDAIRELRKEAQEYGLANRDQIDQFVEYRDSLTRLGRAVDGFGIAFAASFAGAMTTAINGLIDGLGVLTQHFDTLLPAIGIVASVMLAKFIPAAVAAGIAMLAKFIPAAVAAGIAMLPIIATVGAIGAAVLVLEDLFTAFKGGDAFLTPVVNKLKEMYESLKGIGSAVSGFVGSAFGRLFGGADFEPAGATAGGSRSVSQNVAININGGDPLTIANEVKGGLETQISDANAQLGLGGS